MSSSYKIKLGGIWLTDDQTEFGTGCRLSLNGRNEFNFEKAGNIRRAASGAVHFNLLSTLYKGIVIKAVVATMTEDDYEDLKAMLNEALNSRTPFAGEIRGTGTNVSFFAQAMPTGALAAESFIDSYLLDVAIQIITV